MRTTTRHPFGPDNPLKAKEARLLRGPYTQAELATIIDVRPSVINEWEKGKSGPTMGHLRDLLKHYNTWTSNLAGPALDFVLPQNPKRARGKSWRKPASTNSHRATSTGSAPPSPASLATHGG